jgi:hypothetical protein
MSSGAMRRVIVESPFKGATPELAARNVRYARACMRDCLLRNESPYASHLLYTQPGVLRDDVPEERKLGMEAGRTWMTVRDSDLLVAAYVDLGISSGMQWGIDNAVGCGRQTETRRLGAGWDHASDDANASMAIEPYAQRLFLELDLADTTDAGDKRRCVLRRVLWDVYKKGREAGGGA